MKKKFHFRSFISFMLFISITWLLISGTILYIAPPGRVAHWQHWMLFGFDKDQWQAQHTVFSYFFILLSAFHIFSLNWRNLWSYFKVKTITGIRKKKEFALATILTLIVFIGTSFDMPPFKSFFDFGETISSSWEEKQKKAPIPHMENITLNKISTDHLNIEVEEVIRKLEANGILIRNGSQTLKDIARINGKSPAEIFSILIPKQQQNSNKGASGQGYGRMTIEDLADQLNVETKEILIQLKSNNIDANPEQTIKDIATDNGLHPSEIVKIIRNDH